MFRKPDTLICCLVAIAVFLATPLSVAHAGCYVKEIVPAVDDDCPEWDDGCESGVYTVPQYYKCADAGTGESGKTCCDKTMSWIATFYPCEEDIHWADWIICALGVTGCIATGAACLIEPTKISCAVAISVCGLTGMACYLGDYASCVKGDDQSCWRWIFDKLSGDDCVGA